MAGVADGAHAAVHLRALVDVLLPAFTTKLQHMYPAPHPHLAALADRVPQEMPNVLPVWLATSPRVRYMIDAKIFRMMYRAIL